MSNTTVYDVQVRYRLYDGDATAGMKRMGADIQKTESHALSLKSTLASLGAFKAFGWLEDGVKGLISINSQMEQVKNTMNALVSTEWDIPFERAGNVASYMVKDFQKFSMETGVAVKDVSKYAQMIAPAMADAGSTSRELMDMAERASVIMPMLTKGHAGGAAYAAREIQFALEGRIGVRQAPMRALLEPLLKAQGKTMDDFNKRFSPYQRMKMLANAMHSPVWDAAIKKYEGTWEGSLGRLKARITDIGLSVGPRMMNWLTDTLNEVSAWYDKNHDEIVQFGKDVGESLIRGFTLVKETFVWMYDHRDALITIAEAYAGIKVLGAGINLVSGAAKAVTGAGAMFGMEGAGAAALAFATNPMTIAAVAAAVVAYGGWQALQAGQADTLARARAIDPTGEDAGGDRTSAVQRSSEVWGAIRGGTGATEALLYQAKLIDGQNLNMAKAEAFAERFGTTTAQVDEIMASFVRAAQGIPDRALIVGDLFENAVKTLGQPLAEISDAIQERVYNALGIRLGKDPADAQTQKDLDKAAVPAAKAPVINIARIEIQTDDSDAFAFSLSAMAGKVARDQTQSRNARVGNR